jgi:hypothetical protein
VQNVHAEGMNRSDTDELQLSQCAIEALPPPAFRCPLALLISPPRTHAIEFLWVKKCVQNWIRFGRTAEEHLVASILWALGERSDSIKRNPRRAAS